eukprot:12000487-Alexandrium_andersonii.AAC.1
MCAFTRAATTRSVPEDNSTTVLVPNEDEYYSDQALGRETKVTVNRQDLKNPNFDDVNGLLNLIMEGPPGNELDPSLREDSTSSVSQLIASNGHELCVVLVCASCVARRGPRGRQPASGRGRGERCCRGRGGGNRR